MRIDIKEYQAGDRLDLTIGRVNAVFRYIPRGIFDMGSPEDEYDRRDNETQHVVALTRPFFMLETPVTQKLWKAVMGSLPERLKDKDFINDDYPIIEVTWRDCEEYISMLNDLNKRDIVSKGWKFDFPTEAEWEYACRAGTVGANYFEKDKLSQSDVNAGHAPELDDGSRNPACRPSRVKKYEPNQWNLFDMLGNVWEWCSDWYGGNYSPKTVMDPKGADPNLEPGITDKITRGSGFHSYLERVRSAKRYHSHSAYKANDLGFRLVLREREA